MSNPSCLKRTLLSAVHAREVPIFSQLNLIVSVAPPWPSTAWHRESWSDYDPLGSAAAQIIKAFISVTVQASQ